MKYMKTVENLVHNGDKGQKKSHITTDLSKKEISQVDSMHIGRLGEEVAARWLLRNGYRIVDKNYRIKGGEIDIIAFKDSNYHYIEVKTVSHDGYDPYMNLSRSKVSHVIRAVHVYRNAVKQYGRYQIDGVLVKLNCVSLQASVQYIPNINM